MKIEFGDIFLVNFDPSVGHEYRKVRPALVVQTGETMKNSALVTVMPISSQLSKFARPDVLIERDEKNRLMGDSVVKVRQISSFDKKRFIGFVGQANSPVLRKVRGYLRKHFGL